MFSLECPCAYSPQEPDHLIHIFLALAGSTEVDLGLDPTIKCIRMNSKSPVNQSPSYEDMDAKAFRCNLHTHRLLQGTNWITSRDFTFPSDQRTYHITVREEDGSERTFETIRLISDSSATSIYSQGTRIWEVFDIKDPLRESRVLKDSWIGVNKNPEGAIIKEIRDRLHSQPEKLEHIPSILMHGPVTFPNNKADDLSHLIRRGIYWPRRRLPLIEESDGFSFYSSNLTMQCKLPRNFHGGTIYDKQAELNLCRLTKTRDIPRRHWRLVLANPPGIAFHNLTTYDQMLTALIGALHGQ
jgi:hypothetical protein